jgi:hypothetical protein
MAFGETLRGFRQCGASNAELEQEVATLYIEHAARLFALCRNADAQPGHGQGRSAGGISPVLCGTPVWQRRGECALCGKRARGYRRPPPFLWRLPINGKPCGTPRAQLPKTAQTNQDNSAGRKGNGPRLRDLRDQVQLLSADEAICPVLRTCTVGNVPCRCRLTLRVRGPVRATHEYPGVCR